MRWWKVIFRVENPDAAIVKLPLFAYDHSGLTISTRPFHCSWDSGQIGWIYRQKSEILREFRRKRLTQGLRERVFDIFRAEVAAYDQFLTGDVWMVSLRDAAGAVCDSVSNVLGYDEAERLSQELLREATPVQSGKAAAQ